jgi:hypothetical protein
MMKAIGHVIHLGNVLVNGHMDHHVPVVVDMEQVKPHGRLAILLAQVLNLLNLIRQNLIKVIALLGAMIVDHHQAHVAMAIKDVHLVNQDNHLDTKVVSLVKKENLQVIKEKDQAIKAGITPLKSVILKFYFLE